MNKIGYQLVIVMGVAVLLSILLMGTLGYITSRNIIAEKVEREVFKILELKVIKIENIVSNALNVSMTLAQDATLKAWFQGNEQDEQLGNLAKQNMLFRQEEMNYSVVFAANVKTRHFWIHNNQLTDILSEDDPDDSWFFDFLKEGDLLEINVDSNKELDEIYIWINVLMGTIAYPIGIAGVGLPFGDTLKNITTHEFGKYGKIWVVTEKGKIQMDEQTENINANIQDFMPTLIFDNFIQGEEKTSIQTFENSEQGAITFAMSQVANTDSIVIIRILEEQRLKNILMPYIHKIFLFALLSLILVASIFAFLAIINTRILTRLSRAILALGNENFAISLDEKDIKRKDELGDIARGYEITRVKLSEAYHHLRELNMSFERFVPKQFLNRIAKKGIEKIQLGEGKNELITILFSDIRSFTRLSEGISPQELLKFMNNYFSRMDQPIQENDGFIDKFIGDAIMALFDRGITGHKQARDAVLAAIKMQKILVEYKQKCPEIGKITIGIGIHTGQVIIGTVGSHERMSSTVLGDAVNLASRLEGLTKLYHVQIIISSETYHLLNDDPYFLCRKNEVPYFLCRKLDFVTVKGKSKPETIFEVFNSNPKPIRELKQQTLEKYHQGIMQYHLRNWADAIECFDECIKIYPDDLVSKMYIERCTDFQNNPPPAEWDGISHLTHK
jgi:class 3 adenylate cyclase